jgi:hypothetical protein
MGWVGTPGPMLLVRRTCGVVLTLAALLAWADADTPSLAWTRFALTVAVAAGVGLALSYTARSRPLPAAEQTTTGDRSASEQQLAFAFSDDG